MVTGTEVITVEGALAVLGAALAVATLMLMILNSFRKDLLTRIDNIHNSFKEELNKKMDASLCQKTCDGLESKLERIDDDLSKHRHGEDGQVVINV